MAIVRSWVEWKLAFAAKKLRQYKTKILKLSPVVNTKSSYNVSHSTMGFMQFALIDGVAGSLVPVQEAVQSCLRRTGRKTFPAHST